MKSAICTLFEGNYHYGVGALINSLYHYGFRGNIWVGYRGALPPWAELGKYEPGYYELKVANGLLIRFVKLKTNYHFTNFKPHFMLEVLEELDPTIDAIFYFDPDIVLNRTWSFYDKWVKCGVTLCLNNVNGWMAKNHPTRIFWLEYAAKHGYQCKQELNYYFNGGFIGVHRESVSLLTIWKNLTDNSEEFGFKPNSAIGIKSNKTNHSNITVDQDLLYLTDQELLNLAVMLTSHPLSTLGPEGMGFVHGWATMYHSVQSPKPWQKGHLAKAFKGMPPSLATKAYWKYVHSPIHLYSSVHYSLKVFDLRLSSAVGRLLN